MCLRALSLCAACDLFFCVLSRLLVSGCTVWAVVGMVVFGMCIHECVLCGGWYSACAMLMCGVCRVFEGYHDIFGGVRR